MEALLRRILVILTRYPSAHNIELAEGGAVAVFGRYSTDVAQMVAYVCNQAQPKHLAISGNVGKDSDVLARWGVAEAHYVLSGAAVLNQTAMSQVKVGVDLKAENGEQNAFRIVELLARFGYRGRAGGQLVVIAHATQMLRLGETLNYAMAHAGLSFASVRWMPTGYKPNLARLQDQWEICFELIRIAELQQSGLLGGPSIPADLLKQARDTLEFLESELARYNLPRSTGGLLSD